MFADDLQPFFGLAAQVIPVLLILLVIESRYLATGALVTRLKAASKDGDEVVNSSYYKIVNLLHSKEFLAPESAESAEVRKIEKEIGGYLRSAQDAFRKQKRDTRGLRRRIRLSSGLVGVAIGVEINMIAATVFDLSANAEKVSAVIAVAVIAVMCLVALNALLGLDDESKSVPVEDVSEPE
ncbi:hypothetical protein [Myceligenerans salitolerans]|uniref:DUF2721 domain-containing protein n=1 Tax=Myceligenerans salitolerans TaxID=1230528 RepID=A0ABS3IA40_9MICO|nr:hypothetical protein [Myceligenerans salitolerans]MBO0609873.1 hypothetical protein [Myceligenerans salitolerans]